MTSQPTVAVYRTSGTWAKPPGAREIDVILIGASSGDGEPGETRIHTFTAGEVPERVEVGVGTRPGGSGTSWASATLTATAGGRSATRTEISDGLTVIITRY